MEELFGTAPLVSKTGEVTLAEALKDAKFVCIYFSMHNCPPCREFTPIFADLYNETNSSGKVFEVIFVSGDKTQEEYDLYYGEMPWLALPRGDSRLPAIAKKFEVKGVPRLIVLKPDGSVINNSAVQKVSQEGPGAIEEFLSA
jgi:nucleoredoxin